MQASPLNSPSQNEKCLPDPLHFRVTWSMITWSLKFKETLPRTLVNNWSPINLKQTIYQCYTRPDACDVRIIHAACCLINPVSALHTFRNLLRKTANKPDNSGWNNLPFIVSVKWYNTNNYIIWMVNILLKPTQIHLKFVIQSNGPKRLNWTSQYYQKFLGYCYQIARMISEWTIFRAHYVQIKRTEENSLVTHG